MSGDILEEKTTDVEELPQYIQHLKIIHNSTPREGNENSLRIAVECHNLESLERLWEDYRSGRLDAITEKRLVTDDIKKKFQVESVDLTTTILEEDYLACKEFLLNKPSKLKITFFMVMRLICLYSILPQTTLICFEVKPSAQVPSGGQGFNREPRVHRLFSLGFFVAGTNSGIIKKFVSFFNWSLKGQKNAVGS